MHPFRRHLEEIIALNDLEFEEILSYFETHRYKKHQIILHPGQPVPNEFFVISGLLKSSFTDSDGKEHILQFSTENWWTTDYDAFFKNGFSRLSVECLEDVELLALSRTRKSELCATHQKMEHFFLRKSNGGYAALQKRILSLLTSSAEERFLEFSANYPQLLQRVPKKLIASYLGLSRETLSRLSSK